MLFNFSEILSTPVACLKSDKFFFTRHLKPSRNQRISESSTLAEMRNTSWESFWELNKHLINIARVLHNIIQRIMKNKNIKLTHPSPTHLNDTTNYRQNFKSFAQMKIYGIFESFCFVSPI